MKHKITPFLIIIIIALARLPAEEIEVSPDAIEFNYEVLPLAINTGKKTKDQLEGFLTDLPDLELENEGIKYHIRIVEPDPNIEYKILEVAPNPDIDFKLRIIEPNGQMGTSVLNAELSEKLNEMVEELKKEEEK